MSSNRNKGIETGLSNGEWERLIDQFMVKKGNKWVLRAINGYYFLDFFGKSVDFYPL